MKNREWLNNKALIDLLMTISEFCCPLRAVEGKSPVEWDNGECLNAVNDNWYDYDREACNQCVQRYLNREHKE